VIGFGLGVLRLSPDAFWRMTPRELGCAIAAVVGDTAFTLGRLEFETMMRAFPDR
jgi:uncharacterized phage protein (TIGR02216 family)